MAKKKKWGKIGAPKSAKRKAYMRKIAKKRRGSAWMAMIIIMVLFATMVIACFSLGGCTPGQQQTAADTAAAAAPIVEQVAAGGQAVIGSPLGAAIPEPYRQGAYIIFLALSGISNILQRVASLKVNKTLAVVTKTVEAQPMPVKGLIKDDVAHNLKQAGLYETGKAIITRAKSA